MEKKILEIGKEVCIEDLTPCNFFVPLDI